MPRPRRRDELRNSGGVFHVKTRCARGLHLLADTEGGPCPESGADVIIRPKRQILDLLEQLSAATAIQIAGFALMDNHLHLLIRFDTASAERWSASKVARRWLTLHPPRKVGGVTDDLVATFAANPAWVEAHRAKLCSFSQFAKDLKQPVAQTLNRRLGETGALWQGRCKISRAADDASVLAMLAYIDLNPHAAGLVDRPEHGHHTSLEARLAAWETEAANSREKPTPSPGSDAADPKRQRGERVAGVCRWLLPLNGTAGRPPEGGYTGECSSPSGLLPGMTLTRYLKYLDGVARRIRKGKASLGAASKSVFERIAEEALTVYPPGGFGAGAAPPG